MPSSPHEFFKVFLLSSEYWSSVDRQSTECWPITDRYIGEVSTNYRRSVGEVSVNEKLYRPRHIWNDYRPCLDRVSSDYRPSLDRLWTDYRPLYRVSTDYRPLYRPIDRSTVPTVNTIRSCLHVQIKRVRLPATLFSVSLSYRYLCFFFIFLLFGLWFLTLLNIVVSCCYSSSVILPSAVSGALDNILPGFLHDRITVYSILQCKNKGDARY